MRNSRKLKNLQKQMDSATSYDDWSDAAQKHDELSGEKRWRQMDHTRQYDYTQIRLRLDKLRSLRVRQDYPGLLFTLNEGIHGNMGGMGRHSLYSHAKFGTKTLIEQYIDEVDDSLRFLAELDSDEIDMQEKLDFFYRANICFGRSALMLSGGGVLDIGAVDLFGNRIGMGAGWYDRTFAFLKAVDRPTRPLLVAFVHQEQVVERLVANSWDVSVDAIVTPNALTVIDQQT